MGKRTFPHLEISMLGTPAQLDTALAALAGVGRVSGLGRRVPLAGNDRGRYRQYCLLTVHTTPTGPPRQPAPQPGPALFDPPTKPGTPRRVRKRAA
jgi:hypothetical protein